MKIKIKSHFSNWHEVSKGQARRYVLHILNNATALQNKVEYIERNHLRGSSVKDLLMEG